jgi:hypothetical protein
LIEFSVAKNKIVQIDKDGKLSGSVANDTGKTFSFTGTTAWRPEEIGEVKIEDKLQLNTDEKRRLDAVVMSKSGHDLYDVQLQWSSGQENVQVDEYGYVMASNAGNFDDALKLKVGDEEKAITLQVVQNIKLSDAITSPVTPNLVQTGVTKEITIFLEPEEAVLESASPKINSIKFKRGSDEIACGNNISSRNSADGTIKATCDFSNKGAGDWNLELVMGEGGHYEYLSVLRVINPENALNVSSKVDIFDQDNKPCAAGADGSSTTVNPDKCNKIVYNVVIDKPSYLVGKDISSGKYAVELRGQCPCVQTDQTCQNAQSFTADDYLSTGISGDLSSTCLKDLNDSTGKSVVCKVFTIDKYKGGLPQGCDIVAKIKLENLSFEGGLVISDDVDVRVGVGFPKQVKLEGDVAVEGGNIDIESTDENAKSYSMVAEGSIKLQTDAKNQITGYQINDELNFKEIVTRLKNNIGKLIIERGKLEIQSSGIVHELTTFDEADMQKYPEGILYYDGNEIGDYVISLGSDIGVCGPKTLIVEGRDVVIKNNIVLQSDNNICKKNGNFGLIVLDGNIKFDGDVKDASGFYFTTGTIYTGESREPFTLKGVAVANNFVLQRY